MMRVPNLGLWLMLLPAAPTHALDDWQPLPTGEVHRIAFGSCARQWESQPIWDDITATDPDLFLFLFIGDAIYGDWHGDKPFTPTAESLRTDWAKLGAQPGFVAFRREVPVLATWDNHDYGGHDGGAEFELKEKTKGIFLDFFGEPADSERRRTPGIYDSRIFGPVGRLVQVILLDTRWFQGPYTKDPRTKEQKKAAGLSSSMGNHLPNQNPDVSLLGDAQWECLEAQLRAPAEIRLIASSTQVIPDQKAMDEWGNYPGERERLFRLIDETGAKGVVLLTGNVHFAELSVWNDDPYPLYELTSSGMTHVNAAYAAADNRYRFAGPLVAHNFGLVEIDWHAKPAPALTLKAMGEDGRAGFSHRVPLGDLQ